MSIGYRLVITSLLGLALSACSTIHDAIGPDTPRSDLRESLQAPLTISDSGSPFCHEEMVVTATPKVIRTPEPYHATLYFELNKTTFTPDSLRESVKIYKAVLERRNRHIEVVGYTDTLASSQYNDKLSKRRAEKVAQDLINAGVDESRISTVGKGETVLKVPTPDETEEVSNRRVEIDVR
jgi:OOP family OmpA-OmpF porin